MRSTAFLSVEIAHSTRLAEAPETKEEGVAEVVKMVMLLRVTMGGEVNSIPKR